MDDITSEILTMLLHVIQSNGSIQGVWGVFWIFPSSVCDLRNVVYVLLPSPAPPPTPHY